MRKIRKFLTKHAFIFFLGILDVGIISISIIINALPEESVQAADVCSSAPISSTSLLKTYHLLDLTDGFGISAIKDGGYLLTGDTLPASGMGAPFPFIIKTDAQGKVAWSKWFSSQSLALGAMSSRRIGRLTTQTSDGNFVMANDILDFVDEDLKEEYGDILVSKINIKGALLWSILLGDYSLDRPQKLWALPDGGVLLLGRFSKTGYGNDVADSDTVAKYSVFIKIDKNGKVISSKKLAWEAEDMNRLTDGGFIALANIDLPKVAQPKHIIGPEVAPHALPTIIKLDSNLNTTWAKSLEMIPMEINSIASMSGNSFTMGKTAIRMPGGDFRAVQSTPDGGFLAFAFSDLTLNTSLMTGVKNSITSFSSRPLLVAKFDSAGNYQWAKKITTNLTSSLSSNDFLVSKTADNYFVIMQDVLHGSAAAQAPNFSLAQKEVLASNIALIKIDADINPVWVKKLEAERDLSGYSLAPTADKGVVIAASMLTTKMHWVLTSMEPYKEATLIKVDTNGNASGCASVSDHSDITINDQSQLLITKDMSIGAAANLKLNINKKVKEKLPTIKNTARDICQYKKFSVTPICSIASPAEQSATSPTAKTWSQINFDNSSDVKIDGEKNKTVNSELLPILNQLFNNQVKLKDSMKSMWLTYSFPRPVTRADVEAVQAKYQVLGYKIDSSEDGNLWVSKVGLTLHLNFSIQNSMAGKLEVLF